MGVGPLARIERWLRRIGVLSLTGDRELDRLLRETRHVEVDAWQRRAQAIGFVAGNLFWDRPCADEWLLRLQVAKAYDRRREKFSRSSRYGLEPQESPGAPTHPPTKPGAS